MTLLSIRRSHASANQPTPPSGDGTSSEPTRATSTESLERGDHLDLTPGTSPVRHHRRGEHLPFIGRVLARHSRSIDDGATPPAEATGLHGWSGALDPVIEWQKAGDPAGKRISWGPMINWGAPLVGNKKHNHWAIGGCLEKLDRIDRGHAQQFQVSHRHRGPLAVLKMAVGYWDAFNAGHCHLEAMRAGAFEEPTRPVVRDAVPEPRYLSRGFGLRGLCMTPGEVIGESLGACLPPKVTVTFQPQDIRLLMQLVVDNLAESYRYVGFRYLGDKGKKGVYDPRFDREEPYPHEVIKTVCEQWGQQEKLGIIADKKPGKMLDNRVFDAGRVEQISEVPTDFDRARVPVGGAVKFYKIEFRCTNQDEHSVRLKAWVHTDAEGKQTSGWIHPNENILKEVRDTAGKLLGVVHKTASPNPDFFWVPSYREGTFTKPWTGFATNVNKQVDMFQVWSLYQESIGNDWVQIALAPENKDAVVKHLEDAEQRGRYIGSTVEALGLSWPMRAPVPASVPAPAPADASAVASIGG